MFFFVFIFFIGRFSHAKHRKRVDESISSDDTKRRTRWIQKSKPYFKNLNKTWAPIRLEPVLSSKNARKKNRKKKKK